MLEAAPSRRAAELAAEALAAGFLPSYASRGEDTPRYAPEHDSASAAFAR